MPDDFSLLLAADWLEEADFERDKLCSVAKWLREQIRQREKKVFNTKLRLLAAHLNQPVPKVRSTILRTAKNHGMSETDLLDAFCKEHGIDHEAH